MASAAIQQAAIANAITKTTAGNMVYMEDDIFANICFKVAKGLMLPTRQTTTIIIITLHFSAKISSLYGQNKICKKKHKKNEVFVVFLWSSDYGIYRSVCWFLFHSQLLFICYGIAMEWMNEMDI